MHQYYRLRLLSIMCITRPINFFSKFTLKDLMISKSRGRKILVVFGGKKNNFYVTIQKCDFMSGTVINRK